MSQQNRYTRHLDVLIALVTYLALTPRRSRTAPNLARELSLPVHDVIEAFNEFPGLFRRSQKADENGQHFFTLHARYALRGATEEDSLSEMRPDLLRSMLDFISQRAEAEATAAHAESMLTQARRNAAIAAVAAIIAAAASIGAAIIGN